MNVGNVTSSQNKNPSFGQLKFANPEAKKFFKAAVEEIFNDPNKVFVKDVNELAQKIKTAKNNKFMDVILGGTSAHQISLFKDGQEISPYLSEKPANASLYLWKVGDALSVAEGEKSGDVSGVLGGMFEDIG